MVEGIVRAQPFDLGGGYKGLIAANKGEGETTSDQSLTVT